MSGKGGSGVVAMHTLSGQVSGVYGGVFGSQSAS